MSQGFAIGTAYPVSLSGGGTQAALTASNGGIVYSNATTLAVLAGTSTANQVLLSGASSSPTWSTATFSSTYSTSNLLYSNGANTVTGLGTQNGGVLVTSNSGVPSILAGSGTTGTLLQSTASGTPAWSTAAYPTSTTINQLLYSSSANTVAGLTTGNYGIAITSSSGVPSILASGTATGNYFTQLGSAQPIQNIIQNTTLLQMTVGFTCITNTAYWIYIGYFPVATTVTNIEVYVTAGGSGGQTAEFALATSTTPPNRGSLTLTKLAATGTLGSLTSSNTVVRNTNSFAQAVSAGTHLWAGMRTAMATTQPAIAAVTGDYSDGTILTTATPGALTGNGPWTGALVTAANSAQGPNMRVTTL